MDDETYHIERISESRLADLDTLYKAAFGKSFSLNYLKKKFDTSYSGVSFIGFIAYTQSGIPVAYYGVFPCFIEHKGHLVLSAQSGDTMTHPKHQGKGLFTKLAKQTFTLAKKSGIAFIFGFPNDNSLPGFIHKLNWKKQSHLTSFTIRVCTLPISALAFKYRLLEKCYNPIINLFWNRRLHSSFIHNSVIEEGFSGVKRSVEYRIYKQYESNFIEVIEGVSVWLKIDHRLLIGDIGKCDEATFLGIIRILSRKAFFSGIRRIVFIGNRDIELSRRFAKLDKIKEESTIPYCYLDECQEIDPLTVRFTLADWDTF